MDWTLPANLSTQGIVIDDLYYVILIITGIAFVLVEAGLVWFTWHYRDREASYTHGSNRLEIIWTAVPALVLVFLAIHSSQIWGDLRDPALFPEEALVLDVTAQQFEWNITYPDTEAGDAQAGPDTEPGSDSGAEFTIRNQLHVPAGRPVIVRLRSEDVIHSFFVPVLRVKQDAVPGMMTPIWFEATEPGEYELGCAELCGLGHYRMRATVTIHEPDDFESWLAEQRSEAVALAATRESSAED